MTDRGERDPVGPVPRAALTRAQLLTAEQLAERWQVPTAHVHRLAREGRIPCVKLGRYRRFRRDAIEAYELAGARGHP